MTRTVQDIEKEIEALQAEKAELEKVWPRIGDEYWYVDYEYGEVEYASHTDASIDYNLIKAGNCYRTKEEAQKALDRQILITELWNEEGAREFVEGVDNFSLKYEHDIKLWSFSFDYYVQYYFGLPYFDTFRTDLIEKYGERLNLLLGR